jgi:drug/metabolite transporter (DMT)-like permease
MNNCVRSAAQQLPTIQVVFFRNFLACLIILPVFAVTGFGALKMRRPKLFFLRALVGSIGMIAGFSAISLIPLAQMTALSFTSPLFVTLSAVIFLGDKIRLRRILGLVVGFFGVLVILQPGLQPISFGAALAVLGSMALALASILVKQMTRSETPQAIVAWMVILQLPIMIVPALFVWQWPHLEVWGYLWTMALLGTIAHFCLTKAYAMADLTSLQPIKFLRLPFAAIFAWIIFSEMPALSTWVGGIIIFTSTTYIVRHEVRSSAMVQPQNIDAAHSGPSP